MTQPPQDPNQPYGQPPQQPYGQQPQQPYGQQPPAQQPYGQPYPDQSGAPFPGQYAQCGRWGSATAAFTGEKEEVAMGRRRHRGVLRDCRDRHWRRGQRQGRIRRGPHNHASRGQRCLRGRSCPGRSSQGNEVFESRNRRGSARRKVRVRRDGYRDRPHDDRRQSLLARAS